MQSLVNHLKSYLQPAARHRAIALDFFPEATSHEFMEELKLLYPQGVTYLLMPEAENLEVIGKLKTAAPAVVLLDLFNEANLTAVANAIKLLLKHLKTSKLLLLGSGNLRELKIPSVLAPFKYIDLNQEEFANPEDERGDGALLRHSRRLSPKYSLEDLVLGPKTSLKFQEAIAYIRTKEGVEYEWGFRERHSRGHGITLLFHGPSGTGKTMGAEVVAHELGLPLYQVDLSSVVSKWVGETEKNLKAIFKAAKGVNGILLFDEGDAIFGTRTEVKGSQDRYANLEVNYLLQELEAFDGICILSTNHETNMDAAFLRRFTYSIIFGKPSEDQRALIWKRNMPHKMPVASDVDIKHLAQFPLTGGNIKNCIRDAAARAYGMSKRPVSQIDLLWAIKRELQKHGLDLSRPLVGENYWRKVASEWEYLYFPKKKGEELPA